MSLIDINERGAFAEQAYNDSESRWAGVMGEVRHG